MLSTLYGTNGNGTHRRIEFGGSARAEKAVDFILNSYSSRAALGRRFGNNLDPRRDVFREAGIPRPGEMSARLYQDLVDEDGLAAKVVDFMPKECWRVQPEIYETEDSERSTPFEQAWDDLPRGLAAIGRMTDKGGSNSKPPTRNALPPKPPFPGRPPAKGGEDPALPFPRKANREMTSWFQDEYGSPVWETLLRADVQSGIGRYGVVLFGLDDGLPLHLPAKGVEEVNSVSPKGGEKVKPDAFQGLYSFSVNAAKAEGRKLRYLRAFPESLCSIARTEQNFSSPRFGQPTAYNVTFSVGEQSSQAPGGSTTGTAATQVGITKEVHWTRVLHVCDVGVNYGPSMVYGGERLRNVLPYVLGAQKLALGDPEMYWIAGLAMLFFSNQQGYDAPPDRQSIKDQLEEMMTGLQRFAVAPGLTAENVGPPVSDPTPHIDLMLRLICIRYGWPKRIFEGSERGELASSQDEREHKDRVKGRQHGYLTPRLIVPFVDRLILLGVLPEPKGYSINWPDVSTQTEGEKADTFGKWVTAWGTYKEKMVDQVIPPVYAMTRVELGDMEEEEATVILEDAEEQKALAEEEAIEKQKQMIDEGLAPDPAAAEDKATLDIAGRIGGTPPPGKGTAPPGKKPTFNELLRGRYQDYTTGGLILNKATARTKLTGGRWVTLDNGVHVYIKSGRIAVGPAALKEKLSGKPPGEQGKQTEPDKAPKPPAPSKPKPKADTPATSRAKAEDAFKRSMEADRRGDKEEAARLRTEAAGHAAAAKAPAKGVGKAKAPAAETPKTATVGTHVRRLTGNKEEGEALLKDVDEMDKTHGGKLNAFLAKKPLTSVNVGSPPKEVGAASGVYSQTKKTLTVKPKDKIGGGELEEPGDTLAGTRAQKLEGQAAALQMQKVTFSHELGHHVAFEVINGLPDGKQKVYRDIIIESALKDGKKVSTYADTNPHEYFAESFAAYHHDPKSLSPTAKKMVEDVMALAEKL